MLPLSHAIFTTGSFKKTPAFECQQASNRRTSPDNYTAAIATITTIRPPKGNEFFPPKAHHPIPPISCFCYYFYSIEHVLYTNPLPAIKQQKLFKL
jgi:hypothetical protein